MIIIQADLGLEYRIRLTAHAIRNVNSKHLNG